MVRFLSAIVRILGWAILTALGWLLLARLVKRFVHLPAPAFTAGFLNSRFRRRLQPPEQVVGWMDIRPGMQVLELGPGPGTFTVEASRRVGPAGRITAVDIQPGMIARLEATLQAAGVTNVTPRVASAYALPLPDASMDRAYMVTVLAEIPDPARALQEIRRVLKPDGALAVGEFLPDPDYPRRRTVIGWCRQAGFELVREHGPLWHYVLLFRKT
jgi:ubiquinone/menaquinone biosynthesis C-methylase UbiE